MTGSGKGQALWPWEVDQAFRLEEASVGWAQFIHPENSSSRAGGDWLSELEVQAGGIQMCDILLGPLPPSQGPCSSYPRAGRGWGRLGVNTLMNS